ncbi:MAG: 2-C-methyl-D-erythritol 2,4-cyclodiphosphate synthase [Candidatus Tenebribacter burtonii]|jgi:2-C-methyl-D-erythritol 2,4-cyclodiphosphate synthase|nr:2-C-methyl-D-erythritol 2,4-cyclodiphosphate synthase [Candidatus Tenebribacter burtonii]
MRIGYGYDVHKLVENHKLILGGVDIAFKKGLLGHSDADVLIHAIIDAVLGALAKGDIGLLFPDSENDYKDIDSRILLRKIYKIMLDSSYEIGNLDAIICAQQPKLQSYINQMRENVASDLHTNISNISIKATTEENLGITGKGRGITAASIVLLEEI